MKSFGSVLAALAVLALAVQSTVLRADVTALVDRDRIAMGESFRLILTATEGEDLSKADLTPLARHFDILQQSTTSQTRIVNGRRSDTRQLQIDLTPRSEGVLPIPPLRIGDSVTPALSVRVATAPEMASGDQPLVFQAEVDREQVYVQGQLILTLRIMQAINLDGRSISELELDNAFVKPLEQKSFQRTIDGRNWLVHEVRYAVFPQQSGSLHIPAQVFTGREATGRRSFFQLGGNGRRLQRTTEPLTIDVLPSAQQFPGREWLPARNLTIKEEWSTPPEQLRAGDSATRTITIAGEGLQGAQLPPVLFTPVEGAKFYPDQPRIEETEVASGVQGIRMDSAALVPTREGTLTLPEIRIPWWDTENKTVRFAMLPERRIDVAAGELALAPVNPLPVPVEQIQSTAVGAAAQDSALPWQIFSVISALGWALTLAYFAWQRRKADKTSRSKPVNHNERRNFKTLLAACESNDASSARDAVVKWTQSLSGDQRLFSIDAVADYFKDAALREGLSEVDQVLYADAHTSWRGAALADAAQRVRKSALAKNDNSDIALELYPATN